MENESEKELNVADSTEVEEESTSDDDSLEFTDYSTENDNEEDSSNDEETEDDEEEEEPIESNENQDDSSNKKLPQSKEENSKYAAARRKAEEESQAKIDEAYKNGVLSAYKGKINPYTNTEIKDLTDVEVYEDMYKLAESGKDPLKDYASYTADKKREEARIQKEKEEREQKAQQEIDEFSKKYPDVNISSLLKDEMFMDYAEGKTKTLIETYESFSKFKRSFRNEGIKTAKKTIANNMSSPGSLGNSSDNTVDYESMSREQFLKEVEKVKEGS